jgi:preprotein translocase subunit SecG
MQNVLLVIHLIACIALVISVMLQRSEGGALGMGGGGTGGLISGRGAAGVLVRVTMGLAAIFFTTSIVMTRLNAEQARAPTGLERATDSGSSFDFGTPPATTPTTPPPASSTAPPASTTPDPLAPAPSTATTPPATDPAPAVPAPAEPAPAPADPLAPATPNQ